jgi:antitoxin component YwqK of YwqJK toxin-antitoxin module
MYKSGLILKRQSTKKNPRKEGEKDGLWKTYYGDRKLKSAGNWEKHKKDELWTNHHFILFLTTPGK